jgi:hypothetical protein
VSGSGVQWFAGLRSRLASGKPLRACELRPPARAGQVSCSSASSAAPSSTATHPSELGDRSTRAAIRSRSLDVGEHGRARDE